MPGPVFATGDTVSLHTIEEEDLDFLQRGRNHPEVRRPLTDADPRNGEQIREYFENRVSSDDGFGFLICVDERSESTGEASGNAASSVAEQREATETARGEGGPASSVAEQREATETASGESTESERRAPRPASSADDAVPVGAVHVPWIREKHGTGMLMYWALPEHQGNGYVTEATELLLDYAFEERRLAKVFAVVVETNIGSQRVLEKLGFEREGVQRKETFVDGERLDNYRYGLLADEWLDSSES